VNLSEASGSCGSEDLAGFSKGLRETPAVVRS
jgi:hypothetical protein